jgi:hypothetical protein
MRLRNPGKTVEQRTYKFLQQFHKELARDPEARATFAAMKHNLSPSIVQAMVRAGVITRQGWKWIWNTGEPTKNLVFRIRALQYEYTTGKKLKIVHTKTA